MSNFDEFIDLIKQRRLPENPMARIETFARELAEGATLGIWDYKLPRSYVMRDHTIIYQNELGGRNIQPYLYNRWHNEYPNLEHLIVLNYLISYEASYQITKEAFNLLSNVEPSTIFISYKRSESSAFSLLVSARLQEHSLEPFVDMSLKAGEDWHEGLESKIKERDYFIVLLGKETLKSAVTLKEIEWAIEYDKTIIPVWHNNFEFKSDEWSDIPSDVANAITKKHAIRVLEESASGYNTAIVELLNQFGITP